MRAYSLPHLSNCGKVELSGWRRRIGLSCLPIRGMEWTTREGQFSILPTIVQGQETAPESQLSLASGCSGWSSRGEEVSFTRFRVILPDHCLHPIFSVIFSIWTGMLDLIGTALTTNGIKFQRFDGTKTHEQRHNALQCFRRDENCSVLLASIGSAAVGWVSVTALSCID